MAELRCSALRGRNKAKMRNQTGSHNEPGQSVSSAAATAVCQNKTKKKSRRLAAGFLDAGGRRLEEADGRRKERTLVRLGRGVSRYKKAGAGCRLTNTAGCLATRSGEGATQLLGRLL